MPQQVCEQLACSTNSWWENPDHETDLAGTFEPALGASIPRSKLEKRTPASPQRAMEPVLEPCAGIDVGKKLAVACVLVESTERKPQIEAWSFGATTRELSALVAGLQASGCPLVTIESTGANTPMPTKAAKRVEVCRSTRASRASGS